MIDMRRDDLVATAFAGFLIVSSCLVAPSASGAEMPKPGRDDSRVMFVEYQPYNVTRVVGGLRTSTQLEFAADEEIIHVALGNAIAWEVAPAANVLFLKARERHPPTNMQVVTLRKDGTRRSYQLELGTLDEELAKRTPPMLFVKYRYASDEALKEKQDAAARAEIRNAGEAGRLLTNADGRELRNYAYSIQGDAPYEPVAVHDNGRTTTFEFRGNIETPAIYVVREDDSEELVPKSVKGDSVIVHAISAKFILRRGDEVMCVFSERFAAQGVDYGTKTIAPNVVRSTKISVAPVQTIKSRPGVPVAKPGAATMLAPSFGANDPRPRAPSSEGNVKKQED